jgi:uncharacterized protein (TIGR03435 family)
LVEFEVASVKPNEPNARYLPMEDLPGRKIVFRDDAKALIAIAFQVSNWQITGGDD